MTRYRCLSCKGEYDEILPDGYQYFHVCPPVLNPAYDPVLRPQVPQYLPRPNARNENIVEEREAGQVLMEVDPVKPSHWRSKRHLVSEGLGREEVA